MAEEDVIYLPFLSVLFFLFFLFFFFKHFLFLFLRLSRLTDARVEQAQSWWTRTYFEWSRGKSQGSEVLIADGKPTNHEHSPQYVIFVSSFVLFRCFCICNITSFVPLSCLYLRFYYIDGFYHCLLSLVWFLGVICDYVLWLMVMWRYCCVFNMSFFLSFVLPIMLCLSIWGKLSCVCIWYFVELLPAAIKWYCV